MEDLAWAVKILCSLWPEYPFLPRQDSLPSPENENVETNRWTPSSFRSNPFTSPGLVLEYSIHWKKILNTGNVSWIIETLEKVPTANKPIDFKTYCRNFCLKFGFSYITVESVYWWSSPEMAHLYPLLFVVHSRVLSQFASATPCVLTWKIWTTKNICSYIILTGNGNIIGL